MLALQHPLLGPARTAVLLLADFVHLLLPLGLCSFHPFLQSFDQELVGGDAIGMLSTEALYADQYSRRSVRELYAALRLVDLLPAGSAAPREEFVDVLRQDPELCGGGEGLWRERDGEIHGRRVSEISEEQRIRNMHHRILLLLHHMLMSIFHFGCFHTTSRLKHYS